MRNFSRPTMPTHSPRNLRMRKILFAFLLILILVSVGFAVYHNREWRIPKDAKTLKNPVAPSEAALKSARRLYLDSCVNCHGDKGKGDGSEAMMYDPAPAASAPEADKNPAANPKQ